MRNTAKLATKILVQLGFSTDVSMEPGADFRRDKIVELIEKHEYETSQYEAHSCDIPGCAVCDPCHGL